MLIDADVDEHTRRVRFQCQAYDEHFNTRGITGSTCYVKMSANAGTLTRVANCVPSDVTGRCMVEIRSINDQMLRSGSIAVLYGLTSNASILLATQAVTAHPPISSVDTSALENNFVLQVPSRSLFAGEVFTATVTVRATETFGGGQLMLDISESADYLEFVEGSVTETSSTTWLMTMSNPLGTTPAFVLAQLIPYDNQPGNQADQPVLTVRLRVKSSAVNAQAAIGLRVYEFNVDERQVDPGGQVHPAPGSGSWVSGHVIGGIGAGAAENRAGSLSIKANSPIGLFASTSDGVGSLYNLAPLTGTTITVTTVATAYYAFGAAERVASPTCSVADTVYASINSVCGIRMTSVHIMGAASLSVTVRFGGIESNLRLNFFAPVDVETRLDAHTLGVLRVTNVPIAGGAACSDSVFATVRVRLFSKFSNTQVTTGSIDVTSAVSSFLVSSNTTVATVDTSAGTVTGVTAGTTAVGFGDGRNVVVTVDESEHWQFDGLYTRTFSGLRASTSTSQGNMVSLHLQLLQSSLTRTGAPGRIEQVSWAEFVSSLGEVMLQDLSYSSTLTYAVDLLDVISVTNSTESNLGYVEAQGNGHALVFARWTPQCSSTTVESRSCVAVELEEADSLRITNGASNIAIASVTLAHPQDAAFIAGGVGTSTQQIGGALVFATYVQTASGNNSAEFAVNDSSLVSIGACGTDASIVCVSPMPGVSGQTTVHATHGSLTASITVTVVKAVAIQAASFAHPRYTSDNGAATIDTLRRFGFTSSYEQARLQVTLVLSNGADRGISSHASTSYAVASSSAFTIFSTYFVRVTTVSGSEVSENVTITVSGRNGDLNNEFLTILSMGIDRAPNPVTAVSAVRVVKHGATQSTLHGIVGSTYQVRFTATFSDGFKLASTDMTGSQFGSGFVAELFGFFSDHADKMPVDGTGGVSIRQNVLGTATVTVSSAGAEGSIIAGSSAGTFVNLKADDLQIDVATTLRSVSSGQSLANSTTGSDVQVQLFLTASSSSIGSVDLRLLYDPNKLDFLSVTVGGDFGGVMNGELDGSETGMVSLAGATTNYVQGINRHIATVNFQAVAGGVAEFSGQIVSYQDGPTSLRIAMAYPVSFGAAGNVALSISGNRRQRRQRQQQPQRRQQPSRNCVAGTGPDYPVGDTTGDCEFTIADVLITMEYLVRSNSGTSVINTWFARVHASGAVQGGLTQTTMDVDGSTVVLVVDATLMLKSLFGFSRFVVETSSTCVIGSAVAQLTARVEQNSGEPSFDTDPARALETAIYFVVTGAATQPIGSQWAVDAGRFGGAVAATVDQASGVFTAEVDTAGLPEPFGVSVVVLIHKPRLDQWLLGSWLPGPFAAPQTEQGFEASLSATDGSSVDFSWTQTFAPRITVDADCTQAPTALPTSTPTTAQPTHTPSPECYDTTFNGLPCLDSAAFCGGPHRAPSETGPDIPDDYAARVRLACPITCSACPNGPTRSPTSSPTSCIDTIGPAWDGLPCTSLTTLCNSRAEVQRACPLTCERCTLPPTDSPSVTPSSSPTTSPSTTPSTSPTVTPTTSPSTSPSVAPTRMPSRSPTHSPTSSPSGFPTALPTSSSPTSSPSTFPSQQPASTGPSRAPSASPSSSPSASPSASPSVSPSTSPSQSPSASPSTSPSVSPTASPTALPTAFPSASPSRWPSDVPSASPSTLPSVLPTTSPSESPTESPFFVARATGFEDKDDDVYMWNLGFVAFWALVMLWVLTCVVCVIARWRHRTPEPPITFDTTVVGPGFTPKKATEHIELEFVTDRWTEGPKFSVDENPEDETVIETNIDSEIAAPPTVSSGSAVYDTAGPAEAVTETDIDGETAAPLSVSSGSAVYDAAGPAETVKETDVGGETAASSSVSSGPAVYDTAGPAEIVKQKDIDGEMLAPSLFSSGTVVYDTVGPANPAVDADTVAPAVPAAEPESESGAGSSSTVAQDKHALSMIQSPAAPEDKPTHALVMSDDTPESEPEPEPFLKQPYPYASVVKDKPSDPASESGPSAVDTSGSHRVAPRRSSIFLPGGVQAEEFDI